jgi:hypothetical protein
VTQLIYPICEWLHGVSQALVAYFPEQFELVWEKAISVLRAHPPTTRSLIVRGGREPDWATESLNSPAGKLAQALMGDPQCEGLERGQGFPASWLSRVTNLLALGGDARRHALVMFAHGLNWFFAIDPGWTERNLLSALDEEGDNQGAFWAGFFWAAVLPSPPLYVRIKPKLTSLARQNSLARRTHAEVLSGILLAGWGSVDQKSGKQHVTDTEMRDVLLYADHDFRFALLWQLERWCSGENAVDWSAKAIRFVAHVCRVRRW